MRYKKFNIDQELRKIELKRKKNKYFKYGIIATFILLVILGFTFFSKAKFNNTNTANIIDSKVNNFKAYDYLIASYINDIETFNYPLKNTGYELDSFICDNATASWDRDSWSLNLTDITNRTKCNLYFRDATYTLKYYIDDVETFSLPSSSTYKFTSASCDNGAEIIFDTNSWTPTVSNLLSDNTCSLKFNTRQEISLTVNGVSCKALEGMTWREWIYSDYNTVNLFMCGNYVMINAKYPLYYRYGIYVYSEDLVSSFEYVRGEAALLCN